MRSIALNSIPRVTDCDFSPYGNVLSEFDSSQLISCMKNYAIPDNGNIYQANIPELEENTPDLPVLEVFGEAPTQVGFCNGRSRQLDAFEYHKSPEVIIAISDLILVLGLYSEISKQVYDLAKAKAFFVPKSTAVELHPMTLHLAPCAASEQEFKSVIILPKGTNQELNHIKPSFLFRQNKWLLAHPSATRFTDQGALSLLIGEPILIEA